MGHPVRFDSRRWNLRYRRMGKLMSTTTDKPTIEEIRRFHKQQLPSTITMREWEHIDFLLGELDAIYECGKCDLCEDH